MWVKLDATRVVHLSEAEVVSDPDDRLLELEMFRKKQFLKGKQVDIARIIFYTHVRRTNSILLL